MKTWPEYTHFAALDWADDHHDIVVVDARGQLARELTFPHTAEGWQQLEQALAPWPGLPVAVETNCGPAVDQLLQRGFTVYPVMPKAAARYRERQRPSGSKDDRHDAWSLADALRTDGHGWRAWSPLDPLTAELRAVCRDEITLIEERTALVNQLLAALKEYYPAALEAFDDWTQPFAWAFVIAFPTPAALQQAGKRKWEKFLHVHRLWRAETAPARLALFARATAFTGSPALTAAKNLLAVALARLLQTLQAQLQTYRERIAALFAQHPEHDLFGSLPGAGPKLAPRLLSELAGTDLAGRAHGAMPGRDGARDLSERTSQAGAGAAGLHPLAAGDGASVGQREPPEERVGGGLLPGPSGQRPEPCLRLALPGPALAGNHRGHVPHARALRRGETSAATPGPRLLGAATPQSRAGESLRARHLILGE